MYQLTVNSSLPEWAKQTTTLLLSDSRSKETQRAYRADLEMFFGTFGRSLSPESVAWFCSQKAPMIALTLNQFKQLLREKGLSEATINRRLAAVRALLRFARRLGADCPDPAQLVTSEKVRSYRDTRGPGKEAIIKILNAVKQDTVKGKRDYAILRLMAENALRRGEIEKANVGDFEPMNQRLWILGKGQGTQKEAITLSWECVGAIHAYCEERRSTGEDLTTDKPLFLSHGRGIKSKDDERLTGRGINFIIDGYGKTILGQSLHPHALRHTAITMALDATKGDVRTVQRLSRHRDIRTLTIYDDNREDLQGKVTNQLSDLLAGK